MRTTNSNRSHPVFPNLIQDLLITSINQVWVSDITYIRLPTVFVYLAVILPPVVFTIPIRECSMPPRIMLKSFWNMALRSVWPDGAIPMTMPSVRALSKR